LIQLSYGDPELGARVAGTTAALRRDKNVMIAPTRVLHLRDAVELAVEVLGRERAERLVEEGASTPVARMVEEVLAARIPSGAEAATPA
ncbi:MAG TPA: hypothetical protein VFP19_09205, partial [Candidatus Limnocylindrales bacterium]|nr:hypothetical protein [Candidatus Limnocylindrales bacterium]